MVNCFRRTTTWWCRSTPKAWPYILINILHCSLWPHLILNCIQLNMLLKDILLKPRLHDKHFRYGTLKFRPAGQLFLARHSWFLSCKRKTKPSQEIVSARLNFGAADQKLITHAHTLQNKMKMADRSRGKIWPDEATRTLIHLWSEETIQISLDTSKTSRDTAKVYQKLLVSNSMFQTRLYFRF